MTQITEDYVSFETAKLLKEKGFDENTSVNYFVGDDKPRGCVVGEKIYHKRIEEDTHLIACPTLWVAMKWLRKVHEIFISLNTSFLYPIRYHCEIFCYGDNLKTQQDVITENFESPEEACEAAIKYCLENLI